MRKLVKSSAHDAVLKTKTATRARIPFSAVDQGLLFHLEGITHAHHRVNQLFRRDRIELFSKRLDVDVDDVATRIEMNVPDMLGELSPADRPFRVSQKIFEK